ncbi:TPA: type II toxin-antitoxin system PemK/MazF family toxin [Streptococcus suis]
MQATIEELKNKDLNNIEVSQWDVVLVNLGQNVGAEKCGVRPAVVVSKDCINNASGNVVVAPLTKADHRINSRGKLKLYSSQVYLSNEYFLGLSWPSVVQYEDIRSISKSRIIKTMDRLSETKILASEIALKSILG